MQARCACKLNKQEGAALQSRVSGQILQAQGACKQISKRALPSKAASAAKSCKRKALASKYPRGLCPPKPRQRPNLASARRLQANIQEGAALQSRVSGQILQAQGACKQISKRALPSKAASAAKSCKRKALASKYPRGLCPPKPRQRPNLASALRLQIK